MQEETWQYILINYRLPKAITAILVGMGLSISGLLMQTHLETIMGLMYWD
jgi:iron complex transport system permease protein